jgi:uncharacterized protein
MSNGKIDDLIKYRLERAEDALEEAHLLFESDHINTYINRLYYAAFYSISALLLCQGISTSKHSHLRSLFHKDFVKPGTIPVEHGKHFDMLFNSRQEGDYGDFVVFNADDVAHWLTKTSDLVRVIKKIIPELSDNSA